MRAWGFAALLMLTAVAGCTNTPATCSPACTGGTACCDSGCANTLIDRNNCGGCGVACAATEMCSIGHCVAAADSGVVRDAGRDAAQPGNCRPVCASGYDCCGTTCVSHNGIATGDGTADPSFMNCGAPGGTDHPCGMACDSAAASRCGLPHGTTTGTRQCLCGDLLPCNTGTGEMCVSGTTTTSGYACINMATDPLHCGTPPVACVGDEICMAGACICGPAAMRCAAGLTCSRTSGCVDTMTDEMNCGTLANACRAGETCTNGHCGCGNTGVRCMAGSILNGCGQECCGGACIQVDDYNCGGCGMQCPANQGCQRTLVGVLRCGASGGLAMDCVADTDAAPSDGGPSDAGSDAASDGGSDAATDDAGTDANVETGP